jgi:phosphodiesterase/alkaline phosphatase D-like protein
VTLAGGARYSFVTAPAADDPRPVRIAWSGDLDLDPQFASEILDVVRDAEPDLFVSLGDWPYADNAPGAVTLAEYRDRHRAARTDPATQDLLRAMSVRAIYDDHEIRNDWDPSTYAEEPQRHVDGMQAWDEYFPVRGAAPGVRYRSWRWGAHVECFLLDCRRYRSAKGAPDDGAKTMLGATQLAWLTAGLAASTARWKLVFTSVPLAFGSTDEHWSAYTTERARLYDAIVSGGVTGILFLAADQHWFASHRHAHGIRELQAGPLARGLPVLPAEAPGVLARVSAYNVGVLDLDGTTIRARCLDAAGAMRYEEVLTLAELTPTA